MSVDIMMKISSECVGIHDQSREVDVLDAINALRRVNVAAVGRVQSNAERMFQALGNRCHVRLRV